MKDLDEVASRSREMIVAAFTESRASKHIKVYQLSC